MEYEPDLKREQYIIGSRNEIFYKPRKSGTWVTIGDGKEIPAEFVAVFWPRKGVDEPLAEIHCAVINGVPQVRGIVLSAIKGKRELRISDLRGISIEDLLEGVIAHIGVTVIRDANGNERAEKRPYHPENRRGLISAVRSARRQSKRKITDDDLAEVAEIYRRNIDDNPTDKVREQLGVAPRTARLYVRRARDAGFLGEAIRGKAGEQ